jgi:hypothetical protein
MTQVQVWAVNPRFGHPNKARAPNTLINIGVIYSSRGGERLLHCLPWRRVGERLLHCLEKGCFIACLLQQQVELLIIRSSTSKQGSG